MLDRHVQNHLGRLLKNLYDTLYERPASPAADGNRLRPADPPKKDVKLG